MKGWAEMELGGNVGNEPEMRKMPDGKSVCDIGIAVQMGKDEVLWVKAVFFGGAADTVCAHVKKGDALRVYGNFKIDTWVKDGLKNFKPVVEVSRFNFCGGNKPAAATPSDASGIAIPF